MASNSKKTYTVRAEQVQQGARGWLIVTLSDGSTVKARKSQVRIVNGLTNRRIGDRTYDCSRYVRKVKGKTLVSASGNSTMDNGDELASQLRGKELDDVYAMAAKLLGETQTALKSRYGHLNPGMQRMNLGNRMRAATAE